mgnify:CR=1 FL=1
MARPVRPSSRPKSKVVQSAKLRWHEQTNLLRRTKSVRLEDLVAPSERAPQWKEFIKCIVPVDARRPEQEVELGMKPLEMPIPQSPGAGYVPSEWHTVCMRVLQTRVDGPRIAFYEERECVHVASVAIGGQGTVGQLSSPELLERIRATRRAVRTAPAGTGEKNDATVLLASMMAEQSRRVAQKTGFAQRDPRHVSESVEREFAARAALCLPAPLPRSLCDVPLTRPRPASSPPVSALPSPHAALFYIPLDDVVGLRFPSRVADAPPHATDLLCGHRIFTIAPTPSIVAPADVDLEAGEDGRGSIATKASMGVEEMIKMLTFECETVSHNFLAVVDYPGGDAVDETAFPEFPTASASAAGSSSRSPRSPLAGRGRGPSLASGDSIEAVSFGEEEEAGAPKEPRADGAQTDRHAIDVDHDTDIADPLNNPGGLLY